MGFGGGGGGSSGEVSFPEYIESRHDAWLADVTTAMNSARDGLSPYAGFTTVDPVALFGTLSETPAAAISRLTGFSPTSRYASIKSTVSAGGVTVPTGLSEADISTIVNAEVLKLEDVRDSHTLPSFQAGMRDINAVHSSAFVIGAALIEDGIQRDAALLDAKLRAQNPMVAIEGARVAVQQRQADMTVAAQILGVEQEAARQIVVLTLEIARIYAAARLDADRIVTEMAVKDALFDLETFQYGANVMAGAQGGTASRSSPGSTIQSAIGGVLSGAASGAMIGGAIPGGAPVGAAIGGMLGLASALLH